MELLDNSASQNPSSSVYGKSKPFNIKREIGKYIKKWPWFILCMILFYSAAKIYLRYTIPQYLTKTTLKLQESKNKNTTLGDLKNLGMGVSGDEELQGETTVIISKPILKNVVQNLNLNVSYFTKGKIKEVELYEDSPLTAKILTINEPSKFYGATYIISPKDQGKYAISTENSADIGVFYLGKIAKLPFGSVIIDLKPNYTYFTPIKIIFKKNEIIVSELENSINVSIPENKGLLMEISLTGPTPKKSEDILNELNDQYNIDGINDKNAEAENTKKFINERLDVISKDLSGIEGEKELFKRQNGITDLETQIGLAVTNSDENTKNIFNQTIQLDIINSVYDLINSGSEQILPSGLGLPGSIEANIGKYNEMLLTKNRVLKQATSANPAVIQMSKNISDMKNLIRKNLMEARETMNLQLADYKAQLNLAKGKIDKYPTQEKVFRGIERQQQLKEQLYLYLLQKREENAITLAVTAPKAKVVNPAYTLGQVAPNSKQITLGSLALGFLLPFGFFFLKNILDTKVHSKEHILFQIPDASVIAEIPLNAEENAVVHPNDFSVFAESFRILVSNLKFLLKTKNKESRGVILVTSSIKGEGKTTIAMNMGLTLAGKNKVIIIGADIRNPQLHRFISGKNFGLTDFLVSNDETPQNYIKKTGLSKNLDVMFSGAIAPNPNDLLDMKKFDDMIMGLRQQYDYIVIDSAPVMLVSDTLHLIEKTDVVIYVVKSDHTEKDMLSFAADFKNTNHIKNMAFVLNSVTPENTRYGKKYGYGYYAYGKDTSPKGIRKYLKF